MRWFSQVTRGKTWTSCSLYHKVSQSVEKKNPTKVKNLYDLLTDKHKMVSQVALGCRYDYSKLSQ